MDEKKFLSSLEDLTGRVAIVTGGAAGIGLETTIYLAGKGCKVYIATRNEETCLQSISKAQARLKDNTEAGSIHFHLLDLSTIAGSQKSAAEFKDRESRLDIVIANAGISMASLGELSADGYERMFATNHLGHFAFVNDLLDLVEKTASDHCDARIVITSSMGINFATKLDYEALETAIEGDGKSIASLKGAFSRYCNSKLANLYYAKELDRQIRGRNITNVFCNSCHPGNDTTTGLGQGQQNALPQFLEKTIRAMGSLVSNSTMDCAKTQVYLAASKEVINQNVHGQFWSPFWNWRGSFQTCREGQINSIASDEEEQRKLWEYSEKAIQKAMLKPDNLQ